MAKTKAPLFSFSASGTIAKTVTYSNWKGRLYARGHAAPANPKTTAQRRSRSTFLNANNIWDAMLDLAKTPWNAYAIPKVQSGLNAFVGRFMTDNYAKPNLQGMTFSPGTNGAPRPNAVQLTPGSLTITVDFVAPDPPNGWILQSAVAATIRDQDPETLEFRTITVDDFAPGSGQVILVDLAPGASYVVAGWFTWVTRDLSIAYSPSLPVEVAVPLAKYNANAVRFDGATTWLDRGSGLTGAFDSPLALVSIWFNMQGGDGVLQSIVQSSAARFRVNRRASENIRIQWKDAANDQIVNFDTLAKFSTVENPGWHHLLIAVDMNVTIIPQVYLDDAVLPGTTGPGPGSPPIDWTVSNWGIGSNVSGGNKAHVDMSDLYFTPEYLNIDIEANRRKFINWLGQPVSLGIGGITPTGTAAIVLFDGLTATWHTNKGTGGGFNENGALTDAPTSPSD